MGRVTPTFRPARNQVPFRGLTFVCQHFLFAGKVPADFSFFAPTSDRAWEPFRLLSFLTTYRGTNFRHSSRFWSTEMHENRTFISIKDENLCLNYEEERELNLPIDLE